MKKLLAIISVVAMTVCMLTGCRKEETTVNIGMLKGPTGIGAIQIMSEAEAGNYEGYNCTLTPDVTDIVAKLTNGDLDIGALPTNTAVNLYNKTNGDIQMIDINCLGVLYILENGDSIHSPADLKGRTIYVNGQGSNPEYVINYIIRKAGLEPGVDVDIQFKDASEIATMMISGDADLCMLPVPAVTTILMKNPDVRKALDVTEEYAAAADDGSQLTMGCIVARKDFIEKHPEEIALFIKRFRESSGYVLENRAEAAQLVAQYEITGSAEIAEAAIPDCGIVSIEGDDMRPAIEGYLRVLFEASPESLGGAMPGDDFYYIPNSN
ncbi:MAG: ABC transporter substrate-binding protein [Lachnospiraceae bacterium]|nr:ABC transporter substrate-binding protein [Lachnospiraceae bacterium]